jgi:hypothetical protein
VSSLKMRSRLPNGTCLLRTVVRVVPFFMSIPTRVRHLSKTLKVQMREMATVSTPAHTIHTIFRDGGDMSKTAQPRGASSHSHGTVCHEEPQT